MISAEAVKQFINMSKEERIELLKRANVLDKQGKLKSKYQHSTDKEEEIYEVVFETIMDARIEIAKHIDDANLEKTIDKILFDTQIKASQNAINAARN